MQRVGTELRRHNMMPLSRAQCMQSHNGKSRPQMMKNVGVPQENYGTKKSHCEHWKPGQNYN